MSDPRESQQPVSLVRAALERARADAEDRVAAAAADRRTGDSRRAAEIRRQRKAEEPAVPVAATPPPAGTVGRDADALGRRRRKPPAGPVRSDSTDPAPLVSAVEAFVAARGWSGELAVARVVSCWERVVGPGLAEHCRPVHLTGGELTLEATSTAWATQLRLLAATVLARIADEVGADVVTALRVRGPATPSWSRGPLRVRGRGPRDTYG